MSDLKKYFNFIKGFKWQIIFGFVIGILTLFTTLLLPKIIGTLTEYIESGSLSLAIIKKYSLIILASKRARQMHEFKMMQLNQYKSVKTIGKALEEVNAGLLSVDRS